MFLKASVFLIVRARLLRGIFFFLIQETSQEPEPDEPKVQFMPSTVELERTCEFPLHTENIILFELGAKLKKIGKEEQESLGATVGFCFLFPPPNNSRQRGFMLQFIPGTLRRHSLSKYAVSTRATATE